MVFGINSAWERRGKDVQVQLTNRIIMTPFAAKRLAGMLGNVVEQYEQKFGKLADASGKKNSGPAGSA